MPKITTTKSKRDVRRLMSEPYYSPQPSNLNSDLNVEPNGEPNSAVIADSISDFNGDITYIRGIPDDEVDYDELVKALFGAITVTEKFANMFKSQFEIITRSFFSTVRHFFAEPIVQEIKELKIKCVKLTYLKQTDALFERMKIESAIYQKIHGEEVTEDNLRLLLDTYRAQILLAYKYDTLYMLLNYKYKNILQILNRTGIPYTGETFDFFKSLGLSQTIAEEEEIKNDFKFTNSFDVESFELVAPPALPIHETFLMAPSDDIMVVWLHELLFTDSPTYYREAPQMNVDENIPVCDNDEDPEIAFLFLTDREYNEKFGRGVDQLDPDYVFRTRALYEQYVTRTDKQSKAWKVEGITNRFLTSKSSSCVRSSTKFRDPTAVAKMHRDEMKLEMEESTGGKKTRKHNKKSKKTRKQKNKKSKKSKHTKRRK